jgi:hypothetical protein
VVAFGKEAFGKEAFGKKGMCSARGVRHARTAFGKATSARRGRHSARRRSGRGDIVKEAFVKARQRRQGNAALVKARRL